jgi:hypothetical protein
VSVIARGSSLAHARFAAPHEGADAKATGNRKRVIAMRRQLLLGFFIVLLIAPMGPMNADERLVMRVSPAVSYAPANLRVTTIVTSDKENRAIQVEAESDGFYRSSEIPLEGEEAPRTTVVEFRSIPGGNYTVRATLKGVNGREIARTQKSIDVIESNLGEP